MGGWVMVLDATFNNIPLILWWSVGGGNQSTLRKHCPAIVIENYGRHHCHDCMVVRCTTTCAISVYHQ
jgi:hypothetical protein